MSLYKCEDAKDGVYVVKKFDEDFNWMATYTIHGSECTCPAWKSYCKHRAMVSDFKAGRWPLQEGEFYNDKTKKVVRIDA